jgi:twitching motility protein PilT
MKTIEDLLKNLARPEVLEFGLVTNRLPSVNIGGKFEPVDDEAPSTERLMQMLVTMGGGRHVDSLSDKPVQWTTRLDGVGVIAVAAIMRKDVVQARFTVAKREGAAGRSLASLPAQSAPAQQAAQPQPQPQLSAGGPPKRPSDRAAVAQSASVRPQPTGQGPQPVGVKPHPASGAERAAPVVRAAPSSASMLAAKPSPIQPQVIKSVTASQSVPVVQPQPEPATLPQAPAKKRPPDPEQEGEWDDDDEPTLQTLSPPVTGQPGEPRPKPARRSEGPSPGTPERPTAEELRAVQERAAQERAAKEREERTARERAAAQERAASERLAQLARERLEQRSVLDRQARERSTPAKPPMRRISTPTSVDAVDVEITTNDTGGSPVAPVAALAPAPPPVDIDLEAVDGGPANVPSPPAPEVAKRPPASQPVQAIPEKERPRVDASASLDAFLAMAVSAKASDLFVVAGRPVLLRVATDLLPRTQSVPPDHVERITKEIMPGRLREAFDREGSATFALEHATHGRFRVTASKQRTGLALALRVVPRDLPTLGTSGLPESLASVVRYQRGLVLVTSPVAQGKSTTLAALVDLLNRETSRHIVLIEESIEHIHPRKKSIVTQREVGLHVRSKARAVEQALREDSDVIAIGDLSDLEVARLALVAVESGRLVLATMAAPGVAPAIDRFLHLFPEGEAGWARTSLANALRLVVGQRLVPSTERTRLHAAVELLSWSVALHELVRTGRTHEIAVLQERGKPPFVTRLPDALAELVRAQKVTAEVVAQLVGPLTPGASDKKGGRS